jgi:hypothetical protein
VRQPIAANAPDREEIDEAFRVGLEVARRLRMVSSVNGRAWPRGRCAEASFELRIELYKKMPMLVAAHACGRFRGSQHHWVAIGDERPNHAAAIIDLTVGQFTGGRTTELVMPERELWRCCREEGRHMRGTRARTPRITA